MAATLSPLQELADAAEAAEAFRTYAEFDPAGGGSIQVRVLRSHRNRPGIWMVLTAEVASGVTSAHCVTLSNSLGAAFGEVVARHPGRRPSARARSLSRCGKG